MALPDYSMRQLLEAGVHFGSKKLNPKMADFIFGARNNIHIIDLAQTVPLLHRALQAVSDTVAKGGRVLFVGTKRQAQDSVAEAAKRSAQYFVNSRWIGGTLTDWKTISGSIKRLRHLDEVLTSGDANAYTKKERLSLQRERDKLDRSLGGIKDMGGLPDMIFVIDTNKEDIAIQEAQRLNIPVAAVVDADSDPNGVTYVIPGNDGADRAISLYCDLIARAVIDGVSRAAAPQPSGFQSLAGPRGAPDDLKKLTGVSAAIEKKLNDLGVFHYWQLTELDNDTAARIAGEVGWVDWSPDGFEKFGFPSKRKTFSASPKLVDLLYEGLASHLKIVRATSDRQVGSDTATRERAETILTPRILEVIASRARRLRLGVTTEACLLSNGRFDYEFVLEISENIPFRIDSAPSFFEILREELVSFLANGGAIGGKWGRLVLRDGNVEYEVEKSNAPEHHESTQIEMH